MCIVLSVDIHHCYEYLQSAMFCWSHYSAICSSDCSNKAICKPLGTQHAFPGFFLPPVCVCLVTQSCPTLCDPLDHNPPGYSLHEIFSVKNTVVSYYFLLQGTFQTQGSNRHLLYLLHCRHILSLLSHQGSLISYLTKIISLLIPDLSKSKESRVDCSVQNLYWSCSHCAEGQN